MFCPSACGVFQLPSRYHLPYSISRTAEYIVMKSGAKADKNMKKDYFHQLTDCIFQLFRPKIYLKAKAFPLHLSKALGGGGEEV
jgi:hypothetical protein